MASSTQKFGPGEKIIRTLAGFLVSLLVVAVFLKIFSDFFWATLLGSIINIGASFYIFKYKPQDRLLRHVAYGAIGGTTFIILAALALLIFVEAAFRGIAD